MAWPRTRSACSRGTPADDMSERAVRRRSCTVQRGNRGIEFHLALPKADERAFSAVGGEHIGVVGKTRLSLDDGERHGGKDEVCGIARLACFGRYAPYAVLTEVGPAQGG